MRKMNTAECPVLDICKLARAGGLEVGARTLLVLTSGEAIRVIAVSETELLVLHQIAYVEQRYRLELKVWTQCGDRTYKRLVCPGCANWGRLLYLRQRFACRVCQNLNTVQAQQTSTRHAENRTRQLRERLQAGMTPIDDITKPTGMRTTDFNRMIGILRKVEPRALEETRRWAARSGLGEWLEN
jgi:hypothetical protein